MLCPLIPAAGSPSSLSSWRRCLWLIMTAWCLGGATIRAEVQIERLTLPLGAAPSSFAIGLPGGLNVCFDPVRCAVSYVWTGGFLDVTPARPGTGKFIAPARLLGPVVYHESGDVPLRRGDPGRQPDVLFLGYTLQPEAVEFRYTVDGIPVRETVLASSDGRNLLRRIQIDDPSELPWWRVLDGQSPIAVSRDAAGLALIILPLSSARR